MAATVTCTWRKRASRSGYQITIRPSGAKPITRQVDTKEEAEQLKRHFTRLGWQESTCLGARPGQGARGATLPGSPGGPTALHRVHADGQRAERRHAQGIHPATGVLGVPASSSRMARLLGDVPVDQVTREMLGQVILATREQGKSMGLREQHPQPHQEVLRLADRARSLQGPGRQEHAESRCRSEVLHGPPA